MSTVLAFLAKDARAFLGALETLALAALVFAALAWAVKGRRSLADAKAAAGETRINAVLSALDQLAVSPIVALFIAWLTTVVRDQGLQLHAAPVWALLGPTPTLIATVFLGDFVGYWRHRLQHTKWLWPAHAIHHSDTRLTWFSLERMHPVDRLGSALDTVVLAALGVPFWAQAGNVFVRHYYGYLIHADLPWTFGKAGWLLNAPAMHRWHHARDVAGSGANFATVFSVFDRLFGTFHLPGPCEAPLGVSEDMGRGALGQYLHPFRVWLAALRPATRKAILAAE
ncbi:MAG TPA: sterol desaturase family protein [Phenylobacterium sp.]|uniref:sterol desaturase family protein n=1 Tax=Phenylobacterium sp. TaxID=1871053 RepID=UPI002B6AA2CB|nr:sterol desaturase family protein [Phenylobacterium sp.]HSV04171.1 sterol desaturase family protein [Phenylobacterium sp.]